MTDFPCGSNKLIPISQHSWLDTDCLPKFTPKAKLLVKELSQIEQLTDDASSFNLSWEFVGEDLLLQVSDEHNSYLSGIFPGATNLQTVNSCDVTHAGSCAFCSHFLSSGDFALDFYDGRLYCSTCHQNQKAVIPRDILEKWDFSEKPVAFASKKFLDSISCHPIIDISLLNPRIYSVVEELDSVRLQRRKLSLLWCLLIRCCLEAARSLVASMAHRDYMIGNAKLIDVYSISDLICIHSGELQEHLTAAMNRFALSHVQYCTTCQIWTCVCDICGDISRPIWPYIFDQFRRCSTPYCWRAMHLDCLSYSEVRKNSTANATHTMSLSGSKGISSIQNNSNLDGKDSVPLCSNCRRNRAIAFSSDEDSPSFTISHHSLPQRSSQKLRE